MKQTSDVSFSHAIGIQNLLDDLLDYNNNSKCISFITAHKRSLGQGNVLSSVC